MDIVSYLHNRLYAKLSGCPKSYNSRATENLKLNHANLHFTNVEIQTLRVKWLTQSCLALWRGHTQEAGAQCLKKG